jgi:small-conductance mechanosensitive channel
MEKLSDVQAWRDIVVRAFSDIGTEIADFLPNLIGAALVFFLGWVVSRLVEIIAGRLLRTLGVDRAAARLHLGDVLRRAGVNLPVSGIVARLFFWLLMLTFVLSSVETLGLDAVTQTLNRLVAYVPNIIGALLTILLGFLLARFLGTIAGSAAAAAGLSGAQRLGFLAQILVGVLVVVIATEQIGVATSVLIIPLTAVLAALSFAAGLAFALGARPIITHILAGHFLKRSLPRDVFVEIDGRKGVVERIGPTDTLLRDGEKRWSVPNGQLIEYVVTR